MAVVVGRLRGRRPRVAVGLELVLWLLEVLPARMPVGTLWEAEEEVVVVGMGTVWVVEVGTMMYTRMSAHPTMPWTQALWGVRLGLRLVDR